MGPQLFFQLNPAVNPKGTVSVFRWKVITLQSFFLLCTSLRRQPCLNSSVCSVLPYCQHGCTAPFTEFVWTLQRTIFTASSVCTLPVTLAVWAIVHFTRGISSSMAIQIAMSVENIWTVTSWLSHWSFICFHLRIVSVIFKIPTFFKALPS